MRYVYDDEIQPSGWYPKDFDAYVRLADGVDLECDGDDEAEPDLEDGGDDEPSLGWVTRWETGTTFTGGTLGNCHGFLDVEGDSSDDEPSLAYPEAYWHPMGTCRR